MTTVRDDDATTGCAVCATSFTKRGRQRFCSDTCRQTAWRRTRAAPITPTVTKTHTVYECDSCGSRLLGEQRCQDCGTFARRIGPGGPCPHCDEPVAINDLFNPDQLAARASTTRRTNPHPPPTEPTTPSA